MDSDQTTCENNARCKRCGGFCCKSFGCHFAPTDFPDLSFEYIKNEILSTGYISIDQWEGDVIKTKRDRVYSQIYFLRMRHTRSHIFDVCTYRGTCCVWSSAKGCPFTFAKRPKGGRDLIPGPRAIGCHEGYSKLQCATDWRVYQPMLIQIADYFRGNEPITTH